MSKDYLLGIDIGTSACKVAIFNKNGKVMASANGDYPVYYPHEGWAQQKPDEWRQVIFQESRLPEWELMGRAGRLLPLTMREMF